MDTNSRRPHRGVLRQLWFWVLIAIGAGTAFGLAAPDQAEGAKWLADAFLQLVKTITAPVIFLTVVVGIASLGSLARAGGLAARALGYFLVATIVALALGLLAGNLLQPGSGFAGSPSKSAAKEAEESIGKPERPAPGSSASSPMICCRRASCSPSSTTKC
jgi:aerobic C4-dicarboxylate transport protein